MFTNMSLMLLMMMFISATIINTPLNLGLWVLITALMTALTFSMTQTTWFGIMLFLIYVGGMLVMFAYFIAISPNQEIRLLPPIMLTTTLLMMLMYAKKMNEFDINMFNNSTTDKLFSPLYANHNIFVLSLLALILFMALVLVVKVSMRNSGPLRPFYK